MVNLSIKNVPEELAEYLRERANRNNRSLQGELLTILEESVRPREITTNEAMEQIKALDLKTEDEATEMIRRKRNAG